MQDQLPCRFRRGWAIQSAMEIIPSASSSATAVVSRRKRANSPDCDSGTSNAATTAKLPGQSARCGKTCNHGGLFVLSEAINEMK